MKANPPLKLRWVKTDLLDERNTTYASAPNRLALKKLQMFCQLEPGGFDWGWIDVPFSETAEMEPVIVPYPSYPDNEPDFWNYLEKEEK